ncbi:hypothetical protein Acr_05g0012420 [Actinidia rufa]|uniref:Transmembrane protein n=1 Tax=Actinidia rufa TaxID=165716 RepID=A0A7J0EMA3_9ERIC|nr:hypothetical protein Acr_05g0012420 [Actinidia rufa]
MAESDDVGEKPNGVFVERSPAQELTLYGVLRRVVAEIFFPDPGSGFGSPAPPDQRLSRREHPSPPRRFEEHRPRPPPLDSPRHASPCPPRRVCDLILRVMGEVSTMGEVSSLDEVSTMDEVGTMNEVRTIALLWSANIVAGTFLERESNSGPGRSPSIMATITTLSLESSTSKTACLLRLSNESMVPGDNFLNHDLADPFKIVHRILLPFINSELSWQLESGRDPGPHYLFYEQRLSLFDQSIRGHWCTRTCIDGFNTGVEVPDLLSGGSISAFGHLVVTARRPTSPSDFLAFYFGGIGAAGGGGRLFVVRCCIRRALFSFMILICSAIPCISQWRPSRFGTWLVLAIGWRMESRVRSLCRDPRTAKYGTTVNAIVISLLVSLAAAGGFLALFFAFMTAIYIGALSVAVFVISTATISAIVAVVITTELWKPWAAELLTVEVGEHNAGGWIGFFWTVWLATKKSVSLVKHSLTMTGSALSAYSSARHARRYHETDKISD